jgi:hypothetical protein
LHDNCVGLSLKTTSATRLYTNLDILEARKLIEKHSGEENVPMIIDIFRSMQGSIEEQMFHNRRTLHEIIELKKDNIHNEVTYIFYFFPFAVFISYILLDVGFPVHINSNNRWITNKYYVVVYGM